MTGQVHSTGNTLSDAITAARTALKQRLYDTAIHHFKAALNSDPQNPDIMMELGGSLRWAGRFAEALPMLERAITRAEEIESLTGQPGKYHGLKYVCAELLQHIDDAHLNA